MTSNDTHPKGARLCHVIKVDNFDGYGFNLHAEKGKPGQFIGKVDEGSPAETAGLKQGDRIIEVNGVEIANENHKQVVQRIKGLPNETKLLVVTPGPGEEIPNLDIPETKIRAVKKEDNNKNELKDNDSVDSAPRVNNGNGSAAPKPISSSENTISNNEKTVEDVSPPKLNLKMTAAEMRAQLAARKRVDPKKDPMDLKSKFDIVKKL